MYNFILTCLIVYLWLQAIKRWIETAHQIKLHKQAFIKWVVQDGFTEYCEIKVPGENSPPKRKEFMAAWKEGEMRVHEIYSVDYPSQCECLQMEDTTKEGIQELLSTQEGTILTEWKPLKNF